MNAEIQRDYARSGLTIQAAFVDQFKRFPDKRQRPRWILWDGLRIVTADAIEVPNKGIVRAEFLSRTDEVEQGFDIKVDGWLQLARGERVSLLRTWNDSSFENSVEYPFLAKDGRLRVWNVYKMRYPAGQVIEEKWTENAGMWVEALSPTERIYHCSHGMAHRPDFESLVFKITVNP